MKFYLDDLLDQSVTVALLVSAWIEITILIGVTLLVGVALLVSAWIEIRTLISGGTSMTSRTLCECVD